MGQRRRSRPHHTTLDCQRTGARAESGHAPAGRVASDWATAVFWLKALQDFAGRGPGVIEVRVPREVGGGGQAESLHVFVKNTTAKPLAVEDVLLDGISLKQTIVFSEQRKNRKPAR